MNALQKRMAGTQRKEIELYGLFWERTKHPLSVEFDMIRAGGEWIKKDGTKAGNGLTFHYKKAISIIWPEIKQHRWFDLFIDTWLKYKYIGVLGPKNSGKTHCAAIVHLVDYYAFSSKTTILICSTTKESLENRIWGEIKKWHRVARARFRWLPGNLIEGRTRLVTDDREESVEGRDFRNGIIGVPLKKGNTYVGMSEFLGIKNERMRLCGDELQCCPRSFIDVTANLSGNRNLKVLGMGNPADTTDSLGILCEPHPTLGGWDSGIDQTPKTKTWRTRFENGICLQLPGSDCPNLDVDENAEVPFPFLITRQQLTSDAITWGKDDWHYTMFDEGRMPRGQGSRRVITRQLCIKHGAMEPPVWKGPARTKIGFLDAAYRAVGGDRCVFGELQFGEENDTETISGEELAEAIINQQSPLGPKKMILALISTQVIPIEAMTTDSPEDQIVAFVKVQCEQRGIPPKNFFFDSGMRTSLVSAFGRLWSNHVNPIDCGGRPTERMVSNNINVMCCDYYSKFITELWYSVRLIVECGQFRGMTEDVMLEGCAREWKMVGANKIEVETKADMKEKTGRSPDLFDALAVGVEGARRLGFIIRKLANKEYDYIDDGWKRDLKRKNFDAMKSRSLVHS